MTIIRAAQIAAVCSAVSLVNISASRADDAAIAQIKKESGTVYATRDGKRVDIKAGDELYEKDVLDTGADGTIGVTFTDNSVLSLGPNSEVSLAEYRFDSSNFNGAMTTDIKKGTLTMVSGDIARSSPGAMKVTTPTAILGVRGTSFAVDVGGN
ncbi:MAG TPA: FecR domain-containing protein [Stellaceae bacterium]|nr:FecR domain-containing protein [Stellaceae bacterium]